MGTNLNLKPARVLVCGDIHSSYKGLVQALERAKFSYKNDRIIFLGDYCDGWSQTYEVVELLLKIQNESTHTPVFIRGNHDSVFLHWLTRGVHMFGWAQGANHVAESYAKHADREIFVKPSNGAYVTDLTKHDMPLSHVKFFENQIDFYVDDKNRGFVHGGFTDPRGLGFEDGDTYHWDRDLWQFFSLGFEKGVPHPQCAVYDEVFIGHTPTLTISKTTPVTRGRVTNVDTGGGWIGGRVSIMNIDTHEFWQSDLCDDLYPNEHPRK